MRRNRLALLVVMVLACCSKGRADTSFVLTQNEFLSIIRQYHPIIQQAGLQVERAAAEIQQARGAFDPTISTSLDRKTFDGKLYYSYFNPEISIPTWYGIEVKAGLEEVTGTRVTQEATLGKTSYAGVKIPATGLLFDRRRAILQQARILQQLSLADRELTVNNLLFDALADYWNWVREYQIYTILTEAIRVNEERLRFIRIEYEQGSRPAIDTVEALTQLQNFRLQQNIAWLAYQNAGLELSNYMWLENVVPVDWNEQIVPDSSGLRFNFARAEIPVLENLLQDARSNHPKLRGIGFKLDVLETERRLKAQYLLPKLSVNANLLNKGYDVPNEISTPFLENNYKLGIDFSMPLFLREARGAYRATRLKIQETGLQQNQIMLEIENKVKSYYNEVLALQQQILLYEQAYENFLRLYQGERLKFEVGESTLFLLNARENKVLEASQKLQELRTKWHKSYSGLIWAAGGLR